MISANRVDIAYTLTFTSAFHFGAGLRRGLVDRTMGRDAQGYLFVPGSTLKGVLRERCENLARLFGLHVRDPHHEEALGEFSRYPTIVERIFGSRMRPGRVFFDDARLLREDRAQFDSSGGQRQRYLDRQTQQRTQVGMSRLTNSAQSGRLFVSEFGLPQLRFAGQIYGVLHDVHHRPAADGGLALLLLVAALHSLDRLGARKSQGVGQVICLVDRVEINERVMDAALFDQLAELSRHDEYTQEGEQSV